MHPSAFVCIPAIIYNKYLKFNKRNTSSVKQIVLETANFVK